MTLYPLDSLSNAVPDSSLEPLLEEVRKAVDAFNWNALSVGSVDEVLEAFDQSRARLNVVARLLSNASGSAVADISSGLGFLPPLLKTLELNVVATEQEPMTSRFAAQHGIEMRPYDIGTGPAPFPPQSLDVVVFSEVLEHLNLPPVRVLENVSEPLKPGGLFVLTTPNIARLDHLILLASGENFLEPFEESTPSGERATDYVEHVREYSVREVVDAVESAGLGIERIVMTGWGDKGYNPLPNPYLNDIIVVVARK